MQDPGGAFGQADNAIGVARARLAAVLHAQTLCSALSNVNGTAIFFCSERAGHAHRFAPFYAVCSLDEKCRCLERQRDLSHKPLNVVSKELLIVLIAPGAVTMGIRVGGIEARSEEMVIQTEPRTVPVSPIMRAISFEKNFLFGSLPLGIRFFGRHGRKVDA